MIVPMKRLTLIGLAADKERMLGMLQSIGAVQISQGEAAPGELLSQMENRVQRLKNAQQILKPFAPKSQLGPKPQMTLAELAQNLPASLAVCEKVETVDRELSMVKSDIEKRGSLVAQLEPWSGLSADLEALRTVGQVRYITGFLQADKLPALKEIPAAAEAYGDGKDRAVLLACLAEEFTQVQTDLHGIAFKEVALPQFSGTVAENIAHQEAEIATCKVREAELHAELEGLGKEQNILRFGQDAAMIERDLEACKTALGSTEATFLLNGWVREDEVEKLRQALQTVTDSYYLELEDPGKDDTVPTVLKNSKFVTPYEAVTNLYSLPAYGTVDGTPLMAFFYLIFFGMMLSDTAYGIVLSLGCWLYIKKMKPQGMMLGIARVLFQGGLSTIVLGLLLGAFAGMSWSTVFAGTSLQGVFPLIDSGVNPISMLALCFAWGIVHMFYGVIIATKECIKQRDWMGAFVDHLCWPLIVTGLILQAAPMMNLPSIIATIGKWVAIVCAASVFLFSARDKGWTVGRFISGAGKLYDVTAWLSDVLSYSRIFALGLSTAVIGLVLNTLGGMLYSAFQGNVVMQVIGFVVTAVMLVFLHMFMMLISTLGCFVHTARLQYVEFFGKFYDASGKPFQPLRYKTKHVEVQ